MNKKDFVIVDGILVEYLGDEENVIIPDGITVIGKNVFENKNVKFVTIPDSVTAIEESAFYECKHLVQVQIPDSVTAIGDSAFACCKSLRSANIPPNIQEMGSGIFDCCESLSILKITSAFSGKFIIIR